MARVLILDGHPDPAPERFDHALTAAYARGAAAAGHEVRRVLVSELEFPLLRSKQSFENDPVPAALAPVQEALAAADHLVLLYPLWLGTMPALLKACLEQVLRPGFAFDYRGPDRVEQRLRGKSARVVVTMGMPAPVYRWWYRAHSLKSLERNILRFVGIAPVRATLIGAVEGGDDRRRRRWLAALETLGRTGR